VATEVILARRSRLPSSLSAFAERDFRVVWIGQTISMSGTWMQAVAQGLVVLAIWNSPLALGVVNFGNAVPTLLVILFGGVLADRADKRRILLATQSVMCGLALAVGLLVATHQARFWMIIIATAMLGIAFGYDMPAASAFMPELVPPSKISQVVALNGAMFHGTRMIGPAVAGAVIGAVGLAPAYLLNSASFVAVIFSLLIVRSRHRPRPQEAIKKSALSDLRLGIAHTRGRPNIKALLLLTAIGTVFAFPSLAILSPYYVKGVLHQGAGVLGAFWAVSGIGSLLGSMALVWWPTQFRAGRIWISAVGGASALIVMALTRSTAVGMAAFGILSLGFSQQFGLVQTMIQESTPPAFRGRVMSLHGITFNGTTPFAGLAASAIAAPVGLPMVMAASGALALATGAVVLRFAGGGIGRVVVDSRDEYDIVSAGVA
jgi:MFS family permease